MNNQQKQAFADFIKKEYLDPFADANPPQDVLYSLKDMEKSYMAGYTYARWLQEMKE